MIDLALGFLGVAVIAWCAVGALRRRYHDRLNDAYCKGVKHGLALERARIRQAEVPITPISMSLN